MTVTLSPHAEQLIRDHLTHGFARSPEEVIERALESVRLDREIEVPSFGRPVKTPAEAVEDIRKLRKGVTLDGLKIKDLIHEGHKY